MVVIGGALLQLPALAVTPGLYVGAFIQVAYFAGGAVNGFYIRFPVFGADEVVKGIIRVIYWARLKLIYRAVQAVAQAPFVAVRLCSPLPAPMLRRTTRPNLSLSVRTTTPPLNWRCSSNPLLSRCHCAVQVPFPAEACMASKKPSALCCMSINGPQAAAGESAVAQAIVFFGYCIGALLLFHHPADGIPLQEDVSILVKGFQELPVRL
jgi:hypothetical protein